MNSRRVLVVVPDLFFLTRIRAVATQLEVAIETCELAQATARCAAAAPDLLVLDLHAPGEPLELVRALKAESATAQIPMVGFYSHVDHETRRRALAAGVDRVMPRSAFTARLAEILAAGPIAAEADDDAPPARSGAKPDA